MLKSITKSIRDRKDSPILSVLWLAGGTAIGQGILVLSSPFLSRLYLPEDFGLLAVFSSLMGIFTVVAGGRYEYAIPLPEREEDAEGLLKVSLICVLFTASLTTLIIFFGGKAFASLTKAPPLERYLWLLPVAILLSGTYQAFSYLLLRRKGFALMARTRVYQGGGSSGVQLFLGALKVRPLGLYIGLLVGQGAGIASLWRATQKHRPSCPKIANSIQPLAKRYSRFPFLSTWGGLFNALSTQLPVIFLSVLFGPIVTGFYAFGLRVLQTPLSLFGSAIGQVFFSEAAQARRDGKLNEVVESGFSQLLPLGCSVLLPLAVTAPEIFSFVFGPQWRIAGIYAQMLLPWILLNLIYSPLSNLATVLERQDGEVIFQSSFLVARLAALLIGSHVGGATMALGAFALVSAIWLGGFILWNLGLINFGSARIGKLIIKALAPIFPALVILIVLKILCSSWAGKEALLTFATGGVVILVFCRRVFGKAADEKRKNSVA